MNKESVKMPFSTTSQAAPSMDNISIRISALISLSSAARKCSPDKLLRSADSAVLLPVRMLLQFQL